MVDIGVSALPRAVAHSGERVRDLAPGLIASAAVAVGALIVQLVETRLFGRAWVEGLVLAIVLGAVVRTFASPPAAARAGICFAAKGVLELAVVLLGASISVAAVGALGLKMMGGVIVLVAVAIGVGYALARLIGLPRRMAVLIACGNAICGNSAIAAIAPVIEADGEEVATSIAFTAILGVLAVIALPVLSALLGYSPARAGLLCGLTVYAVPQVLAAASPFGAQAIHVGTIVKLTRVLMLGPVCFALALMFGRKGGRNTEASATPIPWFILGFAALMIARSVGVIPAGLVSVTSALSSALTLVAMAGLGLSTDLRQVTAAGPKAALASTGALLALIGLAAGLIALAG